MVNWQVFLINLDHSSARLQESTRQLNDHRIPFERIPAIWGENIDQDTLNKIYPGSSNYYYKKLNRGEVGCYLSHIKAWQKICERKLDFALILEDDFLIKDTLNFEHLVHTVKNLQKGWHYIKLGGFHKSGDIVFQQSLKGFDLVTFKKVPNRTCSQFVSTLGAQRLLKHCLPLRRPIDVDLRYWWEKQIYVQALLPYSFMPDTRAKSEILKFALRKHAPKRSIQGFKDKAFYFFRYRKEGKELRDFLNSLQKYNTPLTQEVVNEVASIIATTRNETKEPAES